MADEKASALALATELDSTDLVYVVTGLPGTPTSKGAPISLFRHKITQSEIDEGLTIEDDRYLPANVMRYGAAGDGSTDDRTAFTAAKTIAILDDLILTAPAGGTYYLPGGVDLFGVRQIQCDGHLKMQAATDEVVFGYNSGSANSSRYYFFYVTVGALKCNGAANAIVTIDFCGGKLVLFADGASPLTKSIAYSTFYLGYVLTLEMECDQNGGQTAWMNDNVFYNGRTPNITIKGDYPLNNNRFYGFKMEACVIDIQIGYKNIWYDCRLEGTCTFDFAAGTHSNVFINSWGNFTDTAYHGADAAAWTITDLGQNNLVLPNVQTWITKELLYEIAPNSRNYNVQAFESDANHTQLEILLNSHIVFDTGIIPLEEYIWYIFDSDSASWQFYLEPYDASKNIITSDPGNDFTTAIGGWEWSGGNNYRLAGGVEASGFSIPIRNDAASVAYYRLYARTSNLAPAGDTFTYFRVYTQQKNSERLRKVRPLRFLGGQETYTGSAAPTVGTFKVGDIVIDTTPSASGSMGWVCVTAGTPGTWKTFGAISA